MQTLWGLQYLRAVAAMTVLLFHAALGAGVQHALGTGGVDIFFVLSGFLMFEIASRHTGPARFMWDRLTRIVPAYWLVTLIVVGTQIVGLTENSAFDLDHFIKSLLFVPSVDTTRHAIYPVLIVGWTLNYEMFFYAIVAVLTLLASRWRLPALVAIFIAIFATRLSVANPSTALLFYSDPIIIEFAFGAAVSWAWARNLLPPKGWWLVIAGALVMMAPQVTIMHRFISYGIPATMILIGVLAEERRKPLPKLRKLKLLGDASYSIYLWHLFIVAAVFRLFGTTPPIFALAVAGGVAAGIVSYYVIERPAMAMFRRYHSSKITPPDATGRKLTFRS